jgi:hypothetical protein
MANQRIASRGTPYWSPHPSTPWRVSSGCGPAGAGPVQDITFWGGSCFSNCNWSTSCARRPVVAAPVPQRRISLVVHLAKYWRWTAKERDAPALL